MNDVKELLHQSGLSNDKAQQLVSGFDKMFLKHNKEFFQKAVEGQESLNKEYQEVFNKQFGDKAVEVQDRGKKILESTLPEDLKPMLRNANAETLMLLAAALDGVHKKFIKEDSAISGDDIYGISGMNEAQKREAAMKLMTDPAYEDPTHPNHANIYNKVQALYGTKLRK